MSRRFSPLLLLFTLTILGAHAWAENNASFTGYEQISEAAYPSVRTARSNRRIDERTGAYIQNVRKTLVRSVETAGSAWFAALTAPNPPPDAGRRRAALEAIRGAPLWACNKGCGCPSAAPGGCAFGKRVSDMTGVAIFLENGFLEEPVCSVKLAGGSTVRADIGATLKRALGMAAYFVITGDVDRARAAAAADRAARALDYSSTVIEKMVSKCPGPFPAAGLELLRKSAELQAPNAFWNECAEKYLSSVRATQLPPACRRALDGDRWSALFRKQIFAGTGPVALKCGELCRMLTCGRPGSAVPRLLQFGTQWVLSLPDGACEGAVPNQIPAFVRNAVFPLLRDNFSGSLGAAALESCVHALVPGVGEQGRQASKEPRPVALPDGPDVPLIDR